MSPDLRRRLLLGVLAVLVVGGVWRYFGASMTPVDTVAASSRRPAGKDGLTRPPGVQLDHLQLPRARPSEAGRNPFVFAAREAPAPVRSAAPPLPAPVFQPPAAPPGPPPLPPIPLKFIGLVEGAGGTRIAVLSDSKGLVAHGAEGAIIDGRYRILSIGPDSIDLAYADGRGRQTLRLSGQ